jgi:hypothetical protein
MVKSFRSRSCPMHATAQQSEDQTLDFTVRKALKGQYHAALTMLRQAVERCPAQLWTSGNPAFWRVAYHTAFFTHLYLQPNEAAFRPWEHCREEYQFLGPVPWPPHRLPDIGEPYEKAQVLDYLAKCDAMVDAAVDALDLRSCDAGFSWYKMPKLEHQIMNIRHIQNHTSYLGARLRAAGDVGLNWISPMQSG